MPESPLGGRAFVRELGTPIDSSHGKQHSLPTHAACLQHNNASGVTSPSWPAHKIKIESLTSELHIFIDHVPRLSEPQSPTNTPHYLLQHQNMSDNTTAKSPPGEGEYNAATLFPLTLSCMLGVVLMLYFFIGYSWLYLQWRKEGRVWRARKQKKEQEQGNGGNATTDIPLEDLNYTGHARDNESDREVVDAYPTNWEDCDTTVVGGEGQVPRERRLSLDLSDLGRWTPSRKHFCKRQSKLVDFLTILRKRFREMLLSVRRQTRELSGEFGEDIPQTAIATNVILSV